MGVRGRVLGRYSPRGTEEGDAAPVPAPIGRGRRQPPKNDVRDAPVRYPYLDDERMAFLQEEGEVSDEPPGAPGQEKWEATSPSFSSRCSSRSPCSSGSCDRSSRRRSTFPRRAWFPRSSWANGSSGKQVHLPFYGAYGAGTGGHSGLQGKGNRWRGGEPRKTGAGAAGGRGRRPERRALLERRAAEGAIPQSGPGG